MNLEHLLRESTERYRALLLLQVEVNDALKRARPDEVEDFAEHLDSLQRQAEMVDHNLLPLLEKAGAGVATHPLFQQRKVLLEECAQQIGLLLSSAEAGKAVAAAELLQVREGRTAMAGYESGDSDRGKMLSGRA